MKYQITLTENQVRVTQAALEEYFRLRMGQTFDFANDIASQGVDLSPDNPKHDWLFDMYICNRDWIRGILDGMFKILWIPYGTPSEKTDDMMIAECIWDAIRFSRGQSRWNEPFKIGTEPVPKIVKEE